MTDSDNSTISNTSYDFSGQNTLDFKHKNSLDIVLSNARSLLPKIDSMIETMQEISCEIAVATETWFQDGPALDRRLEAIEAETGYATIRRNRQTGRGGGVAIIYKRGDIKMDEIKTSKDFEVVAAIARRTGQRRKVAVVAVYVPPNYNAEQNNKCLDYINGLIGSIKQKYNSPYILVAGDFNHRPIANELSNYPDLQQVKTPPTRGRSCLDIVLTNFHDKIERAGVMEPIFNQEGQTTDHKTVYVKANIPCVDNYTVKEYTYLRQTEEGDLKMKRSLKMIDWGVLTSLGTVDQMVEYLHGEFEKALSSSYQKITRRRKLNEPQWMNESIRKLIARRRAIFRDEGRTERWKKLKKKIARIIKNRRKKFNQDKKDKMLGQGANFFDCVKSVVNNDNVQAWSPSNLFPDKSDTDVANICADYFNGISCEYSPISYADVPTSYDQPIPELTEQQVREEIVKGKKPKLRVSGDIFVNTLVESVDTLAKPVTFIYNQIMKQKSGPSSG